MRLLLVIGILFICFISGVMYGTNNQSTPSKTPVTNETHMNTESEINDIHIEEPSEPIVVAEAPVTPAYKLASALESIVNFFYEIVVEVLFQVSKLFF